MKSFLPANNCNIMKTADSFWPICQKIKLGHFVDLTHSFDSKSPLLEESSLICIDEKLSYQVNGCWTQQFQFDGQTGTHVNAPAYFIEKGRTIEQIYLQEMILPLVVIDIHEQVAHNPDYILLVDDVLSWEDQYGPIPNGAFVALRTDWSKRWPDNTAMHHEDDENIPHSPGWSLDALSYLYESCEITASGQETFSPDTGFRSKETHEMCKRYILSHNHYQINLLANLDQCPSKGAIVICTFPKPHLASSFPARVFAICPASSE